MRIVEPFKASRRFHNSAARISPTDPGRFRFECDVSHALDEAAAWADLSAAPAGFGRDFSHR
jgi:hypothetical protein